ncbi:MAG: DUF2007 domain-containing protein [Dehalococcoidales bacterium]|nr:DUF2007 domain-containing protein [Dehalococcoidales bacterium]
MNPNNDLVEIYIAKGEAEAQIIKGLLESYGIPCLFKPYASFSASVFVTDGTGQIPIMVNKEDEKDARELVKGETHA